MSDDLIIVKHEDVFQRMSLRRQLHHKEQEEKSMRQYFAASLCRNGILGGVIIAGDEGITYKTGKLTVPPELRNLEMKYGEIRGITCSRPLVFPTVSVRMNHGERYKFIVFRCHRFCTLLKEKGVEQIDEQL